MNAQPVTARRLVLGVVVAAALLTSACAAGQHAETANEKPTLDGTNASVGPIDLRGLAVEAPTGASYAPGSDPAIKLVLVNSGRKPDALTSITSTSAKGWGAYGTAAEADAVIGAGTQTAGQTLPQPASSVTIPPGSQVSWGTPEATGVLLLRNLTGRVFPGTNLTITFTFANAGSVQVVVPVQLTAGAEPPSYVPSEASSG